MKTFFRILIVAIALDFIAAIIILIQPLTKAKQIPVIQNSPTPNSSQEPLTKIEQPPIIQTHITLDFYKEHYKILNNPSSWTEKLTDAYNAYADLVGITPYDGSNIIIKETPASEMGGARLLSGNPIKWLDSDIPESLKNINGFNDLGYGPIHELGHDFDYYLPTAKYLIGSTEDPIGAEQWANFKLTYVADTLAKKYPTATFYQPQVGFLPIGEFSEKYFVDIFAKEWLASPKNNWKDMNHDAFTGLLYSLTKRYGWEPFKETFRDYNSYNGDLPSDDLGKIELFANILSRNVKTNLTQEFIYWGIPLSQKSN